MVTDLDCLYQCLRAFVPHYNDNITLQSTGPTRFQCLPAFIPHYYSPPTRRSTRASCFNAYRHSFLITTAIQVVGVVLQSVSMPTGIHSSLLLGESLGTQAQPGVSMPTGIHSSLLRHRAHHARRLRSVSMPTGIHSSLLLPTRLRGERLRLFQCLPAFIPHYYGLFTLIDDDVIVYGRYKSRYI